MKNLNFPVLSSIILALAALTGGGILTLNAEFLLAVCFTIFVFYFYLNLSDNLVEPLEEQSNIIQKEFEQYYDKYEAMLESLVSYHERRVSLAHELKQIASFSKEELVYLVNQRQKSFAQEISDQITQKLKTLELKDQEIYKDIQNQASSHFTEKVMDWFSKDTESKYSKDILVQEAIGNIEQITKTTPNGYSLSEPVQKKLHECLLTNSVANVSLEYLIVQSAKNI